MKRTTKKNRATLQLETGDAEMTIKLKNGIVTVTHSDGSTLHQSAKLFGFWTDLWRVIDNGEPFKVKHVKGSWIVFCFNDETEKEIVLAKYTNKIFPEHARESAYQLALRLNEDPSKASLYNIECLSK